MGEISMSPARIGNVSQRDLVPLLAATIDAAKGHPSAHRDIARARLRELKLEHWNTPYVLNQISTRRCRFLQSLGWPVSGYYAFKGYRGGREKKKG
jgi:hypothetical protein